MSMTHSNSAKENTPPRPPSTAGSTHSSSSSSSKHVKCIGRYVLTGNTLGKGNFARVETAVHTLTRAKVAVKIIETDKIKEEYVRKNLLREAQLMRRLRHPNIIRLYETMKANNLYCLVTEIAEGGELLSFVRNDFKERRLPEATTRPFVRQLVSALYYLHSHGIVHRDLKMENILLDKKKRSLKIVDFGLSNAQKAGALLQTHCGSPEYAAPELFIPGRQYGPEVDVWSLGVNMYAMLMGKLPFRSPRQGTKKRQKLLEQISAGITEHHEKEMIHLSTGAQDLIRQFLQPDPSRRIKLEDVMHHPWVTKDGTQALAPYEYIPPDPITQNMVMELIQKVVGEPVSQIKETVKRDRCDWLAAIYNLLMDQPEGRNVLQRMLTEDPAEQLSSAAEYQGSSEHLSLSQSQQSQDIPENPDVIGLLSKHVSMTRAHRTSITESHRASETPTDYETATLPLTKRQRHPTADHRTIGQLRGYHVRSSHQHHRPPSGRHIAINHSPGHEIALPKKAIHSPTVEDGLAYIQQYRPEAENFARPHSRMSAPEPLPIPFQRSLFLKQKHQHHNQVSVSPSVQSPTTSPPPSARTKSPSNLMEPLLPEASTHLHSAKGSKKRSGGGLKPVSRKSLSASIDAHLDSNPTPAIPWRGKAQVAPLPRRLSMEAVNVPNIGWPSQAQFGSNSRLASVGKSGPADIQSLMQTNPPSHADRDLTSSPLALRIGGTGGQAVRSNDSFDLKHEMFSQSPVAPSRPNETVTEGVKIDMLPSNFSQKGSFKFIRSSSAKIEHSTRQPNNITISSQPPEYTLNHMDSVDKFMTPKVNGIAFTSTSHPRELPHIDQSSLKTLDKASPSGRKKSIGGLLGKAFKTKIGTKERTLSAGSGDV